MKYLKAYAVYLLVLFLGVTSVLLYQAWGREATHAERVKKLEADVRTYAGKYLDLQEQGSDELDSARSDLSMAKWRLEESQKDLETCLAKIKK